MRTHVSGAEVDHISARGPPANSAFTISIAFICTYVIFALAVTPFAGNPGPEISGITALFRAYPHWSLLILGSAFLYSALMVVPHLLTFPGAVLANQTLVGSSRHAPGYIFVLWIAGFALLTFVSVVFEARTSRHQIALVRVNRAVCTAVSAASVVVLTVTLTAILLGDHLPPLIKESPSWTEYSQFLILIAIAFLVSSIAIVLFRIRNELFLWLVMALATDVIAEVGGARYTVGWLMGRVTWIISGCVLFLYFLRQFVRQQNQLVVSDRALRASEQNFQMLVQGVKGYAIHMLDPEGYVSSSNSGAESIEGYREEEIIGQHFSRFYAPEDQQSGLPAAALKQAKEKGKYDAEGWRVRKDGSRFSANVVINPIFREEEALVGFAKIVRDITERKDAEQHQELLVAELDHRVKNILAQVAVVAVSTRHRA